ncbi:hypothetical protein GQ44DRAFT_723906 [Phaeosphaeriaceae sp. PMI808]|nr:hypothetical protein GQ44DRAFT_723906 [Phaeosphaeriaceae sp. PMI808]
MANTASSRPCLRPNRHETSETNAPSSKPCPPHLPHTDAGAATTDDTAGGTARNIRRKEWHANKISERRAKQRRNKDAESAERSAHEACQSTKIETHAASREGCTNTTTSVKNNQMPKRLAKGQETAKASKKRSEYSKKTSPQHVGDVGQAPRTSQSTASYERHMIRRYPVGLISKTLAPSVPSISPYDNGPGFMDPGAWQQGVPWLLDSSNPIGWDSSGHRFGPGPPFVNPFYDVPNQHAWRPPHAYRLACRDHFPMFEPFYTLQQSARNGQSRQDYQHQVAPSHSSATQAGDQDGHHYAVSPAIVCTPAEVHWKETASGLLGITPPTPSSTGSQELFNDLGPTSEKLTDIPVMPDYESSNCAPRIQIDKSDWDTETKVTQSHHHLQTDDKVVFAKEDDYASDKYFVERRCLVRKLLHDSSTEVLAPPLRSQSLPYSFDSVSLVSHCPWYSANKANYLQRTESTLLSANEEPSSNDSVKPVVEEKIPSVIQVAPERFFATERDEWC